MKTIFESESIRYVEVTDQLIEEYLSMVNDIEHVGSMIGRTDCISEEKERSWIDEKLKENAPVFSMIEKAAGDFIGNVELMDVQNSSGELGIAIKADKQNQGFGKEAIRAIVEYGTKHLGLRRVFLKVYPHNQRAIHVYQKCGFREYDRTENDIFMELYLDKFPENSEC